MSKDNESSLTVFHATTRRAAEAIAIGGWQRMNPLIRIEEISSAFDISSSEVIADLQKFYRFAMGTDRGSWVSFATTWERAEHRWAQRAPEVDWETLWAVYRIRLMSIEDPWAWHGDVAGHAWVWDQMREDEPAVLAFRTSYSELVDVGAHLHGFRHDRLPSEVELMDGWATYPEIGIDAPFTPDPERITVIPVERHLPWDVYVHKLGLTTAQFMEHAANGRFGVPASDAVDIDLPGLDRPWWNASGVEFPGRAGAESWSASPRWS